MIPEFSLISNEETAFLNKVFNPCKAGLFEGSFFWEGEGMGEGSISYSKENFSNINIHLYNY